MRKVKEGPVIEAERLCELCQKLLDDCQLMNDALEGYFNDPAYVLPSRYYLGYAEKVERE